MRIIIWVILVLDRDATIIGVNNVKRLVLQTIWSLSLIFITDNQTVVWSFICLLVVWMCFVFDIILCWHSTVIVTFRDPFPPTDTNKIKTLENEFGKFLMWLDKYWDFIFLSPKKSVKRRTGSFVCHFVTKPFLHDFSFDYVYFKALQDLSRKFKVFLRRCVSRRFRAL